MPLSKQRNKERMRILRATSVQPKVVQPTVSVSSVQPKLEAQGIKIEGNRIVSVFVDVQPKCNLPICNEYNFRQFKPGDKVLVRRGTRMIETIIPELDADGHAVW